MSKFRRHYGKYFLRYEFGIALGVVAVFVVWYEWLGGEPQVNGTLDNNRAAVYGAIASIFGSLLGFVITATSVVVGFSASERLAIVRESKHYAMLWRVFTASMRALGFATVAALVGLIMDRDDSHACWAMYLAVWGSVLAVFRIGRCMWVLENVVELVGRPRK